MREAYLQDKHLAYPRQDPTRAGYLALMTGCAAWRTLSRIGGQMATGEPLRQLHLVQGEGRTRG